MPGRMGGRLCTLALRGASRNGYPAFSIFRAFASTVFVSLPCRRGAESRISFISASFTSAAFSALRGPPHCLSEK